jgi:hypothetical protein
MSNERAYTDIAGWLFRPQERPFLSATFSRPNATVKTTFDRKLQTPSIWAKLVLDATTIEVSAEQGKDKPPVAIVRPDLKQFGVNLEYYPLKDGNFKLSGTVPVCTLGKVLLTYVSEDSKFTAKLNGSVTARGAKITGEALFPGAVRPNAVNIGLEAGSITARLSADPKRDLVSLFLSRAALSFGASAEIATTAIGNPKFYGKYVYGDATVGAILSLLPEKNVDLQIHAKKGCCPARGHGVHGIVFSLAEGKPSLSVGGKVGCKTSGKKIAYQISSAGSLGLTFVGTAEQWSAKYWVSGNWAKLAFNTAALTPTLSFGVRLNGK